MERVERRRWRQVPMLHFDAIIGSTTKIYGDRRLVVIPLNAFMADWTAGPFGDLLRAKRPQLLPG